MSDDCDRGTNEPAPRPSKGSDLANDRRTNPFAAGVDRRRLLQASPGSIEFAVGDVEATYCMGAHRYCG